MIILFTLLTLVNTLLLIYIYRKYLIIKKANNELYIKYKVISDYTDKIASNKTAQNNKRRKIVK